MIENYGNAASRSDGKAGRVAIFVIGVAIYACFLATFTYAVGFVGGVVVPKGINDGGVVPWAEAIVVNAILLSLFVVQHTIMARPAFKRWWTRVVPKPLERSLFVLATCMVLALTFWQWRPMPVLVWVVESPIAIAALHSLFVTGWLLVLYATFCIDHFDLFGLRQVVLHLRGKEYTHPGFAMPALYRWVRNPLMLGFLIAFWSAPTMTAGRLLFAVLTTGYIFMGVWFEERDLAATLGEPYRQYRARTPMLLPWPRRRQDARSLAAAEERRAANIDAAVAAGHLSPHR